MGPFYFAWVANDLVEFNPSIHAIEQLDIYTLEIDHQEGQFATLKIQVKNPRVGLLAPGRMLWAWISWDGPEGIVPLFFGRIVGLPENLDREIVELSFLARPDDYQQQKIDLANVLKVAPYWDAVWYSPEQLSDPELALESRTALWHIDRTTLEVSISDVIAGEDGFLVFDQSEVFYDSVDLKFGDVPLSRVDVHAEVSWSQFASGSLEIPPIMLGFGLLQDPYAIYTYTGAGLQSAWPKGPNDVATQPNVPIPPGLPSDAFSPSPPPPPWVDRVYGMTPPQDATKTVQGTSLGGGWKCIEGSLIHIGPTPTIFDGYGPFPIYNFWWNVGYMGLTYQAKQELAAHGSGDGGYGVITDPGTEIHGPYIGILKPQKYIFIPRWRLMPKLVIGYDTGEQGRERHETLAFSVYADVQSVQSEPDGADVETLTFNSSELASPIDPGGATPRANPSDAVYFATPRGDQSLQYLLRIAMAHLINRSRAAKVTFEISFPLGVASDISCRKSATIIDDRLPGGMATGKIVQYTFSIDGDKGEQKCAITLACAVGRGNSVGEEPGNPVYCDPAYVGPDYQRYDGRMVLVSSGDLTYELQIGLTATDDGVDFNRMTVDRCLKGVTWKNSWEDQEKAMSQAPATGTNDLGQRVYTVGDFTGALSQCPTRIGLTLVDITNGPFTTAYTPAVSTLMIPRMINLEA